MSKRPPIDLAALTAEEARPMPEATQRASAPVASIAARRPPGRKPVAVADETRTENLEALAFKVPPSFRKRFKLRAAESGLKLNELLFQALRAWEAEQGIKG